MRPLLIISLAALGRTDEARESLAQALALKEDAATSREPWYRASDRATVGRLSDEASAAVEALGDG